MIYKSTRSDYSLSAPQAVLKGLAPDGGLFVCPRKDFQGFAWKDTLDKSPMEIATDILSFLLPDFANMPELVKKAYTDKFDTEELTPLVSVGDHFVLELFHGPTSAFKDVALSMLPQLITSALSATEQKEKAAILTATSGDTGKAALAGFHDVAGTDIMVFYPHGGVSAVQRLQMVSQVGANVKVCAVKGNFDDCQRGVKEAFAALQQSPVSGVSFTSANSINIGRLAPQVTYYFLAYQALLKQKRISLGDKVIFSVPTGNFGDILAGLYAQWLGLPIEKLICASNANDVLYDFLSTGIYNKNRPFYKTTSPSMDILVSSNLERLLYYANGEDAAITAQQMQQLNTTGTYQVSESTLSFMRNYILPGRCDEEENAKEIKHIFQDYQYLCDPHTAVSFKVGEEYKTTHPGNAPLVVLSTASPYKFPAAVLSAISAKVDSGIDEFAMMKELNQISGVKIPKNLAELQNAKELHTDVIEKQDMLSYILQFVQRG